jgi:hypothetical protein
MSIQLHKPYRIIPYRQKRYESHYHIPASVALVVPTKVLGSESSCDVRWEDGNGELHLVSNLMFANDNLVELNPMLDTKLHEIWDHYYKALDKKLTDN